MVCSMSSPPSRGTEDVADIVLNIKALCFKVNLDDQGTYEPKTFYIKKSGEGEVTGADIITDQDTEVLNPELHIATLDKNANLNMENLCRYRTRLRLS